MESEAYQINGSEESGWNDLSSAQPIILKVPTRTFSLQTPLINFWPKIRSDPNLIVSQNWYRSKYNIQGCLHSYNNLKLIKQSNSTSFTSEFTVVFYYYQNIASLMPFATFINHRVVHHEEFEWTLLRRQNMECFYFICLRKPDLW